MHNLINEIELNIEDPKKWALVFQIILSSNSKEAVKSLKDKVHEISNDLFKIKLLKRKTEGSEQCCVKKIGLMDMKIVFQVDDINNIVKKLQDLNIVIQNFTFDPKNHFYFAEITGPDFLEIQIRGQE